MVMIIVVVVVVVVKKKNGNIFTGPSARKFFLYLVCGKG